MLVGTPAQVADGLETWVEEADVDGFNFVSRDTFHPASDDVPGILVVTDIVIGVCLVSWLVQRYHRAVATRAQSPRVVLGRVY